jgi:aerobic carbon-monoxide dehydrogenase large subunit
MSVERTGIGAREEARVTIHPDGSARVHLGSSPGGQGHDTTFAQVVATRLGWPLDRVQVLSGDTDKVPKSAVTAASRSAYEVGNAAALAGAAARRRLLEMGAELLEADPADLVLTPDGVHVQAFPGRGAALHEILRDGPLEVSESFKASPAYASACHAAVVEVDSDTGSIRIVRYVIGHDSGRSINPLLVEGQLHGGFAHGLGYALFEEAVYTPDGSFISASFLDYLIPGAPEVDVVPQMLKVESEVFDNPEGFKGMGESATIRADGRNRGSGGERPSQAWLQRDRKRDPHQSRATLQRARAWKVRANAGRSQARFGSYDPRCCSWLGDRCRRETQKLSTSAHR